MIYVRWSVLILLIFVGSRSLVTSQWHFERAIGSKPAVTLVYAVGKDGVTGIGA